MSSISKSALLVAALSGLSQAANYTEWMASSFMTKNISLSRNYANGVLYTGMEFAYNKTKDERYFTYIKSQVDAVVDPSGGLINYPASTVSLDDIRIGLNLLWLWTKTGDDRYKIAADTLREQLNFTPRNKAGGFWHRKPTYPNQMWLDGIYMAENFYAQYTAWFQPNNATAWDDIVLQFDLIEEHCLLKSGLLVHGYDESKVAVWAGMSPRNLPDLTVILTLLDPVTGGAPHVWDRAVGWYFMSLVDILDYLPRSHSGYEKSLRRFQSLAKALKKTQDKSGGWWLIMDGEYPSDPRNYIESSGTAMFAYGFLKGIRKGYIRSKDYMAPAKKAYNLMVDKFVEKNANGTLNWLGTVQVGSLVSNGTFEVSMRLYPMQRNDLSCMPVMRLRLLRNNREKG
ncbi:glycoside hydrolase family 88/105 protein [Aspergillus novofumigatus IBT 16806]|uniref:Putative cell wall glycosyl hydrolase YteR n=1 Tax=Aspergillus novofumigatus (strain IBT 16806) TaxID=1392255 RepID=A0A2I1CNS6_ASPN1|nr:putative cell wall glycosyl hydrolase YteR [Aspergillus novofumigatus IBT 16806]PKX99284.1 putative cell wall glycosyl hydrolase YteR [Aspergillus novofumigatus IBT 16806]